MSWIHEADHRPIKKRKPKFDKKKQKRENNSKWLRKRTWHKNGGKRKTNNQKQFVLVKHCENKRGTPRDTIPIDDYI